MMMNTQIYSPPEARQELEHAWNVGESLMIAGGKLPKESVEIGTITQEHLVGVLEYTFYRAGKRYIFTTKKVKTVSSSLHKSISI